jgi:hypothetical protein
MIVSCHYMVRINKSLTNEAGPGHTKQHTHRGSLAGYQEK